MLTNPNWLVFDIPPKLPINKLLTEIYSLHLSQILITLRSYLYLITDNLGKNPNLTPIFSIYNFILLSYHFLQFSSKPIYQVK